MELPAGPDVDFLTEYVDLPGDPALTVGRMLGLLRILAVFLAILASLVVAIAIPAVARDLGMSVGYGTSAFFLASASFIASLYLLVYLFRKPLRWYRSNLAQRSRDQAMARVARPTAAHPASPPLAELDARFKP